MRRFDGVVMTFVLVCCGWCATAAAQIRPVELTIVEGTGGLESLVLLDVSVKFDVLGPISGGEDEIPTTPQDPGTGTNTGWPSDRAPAYGTVSAILDQSNNKLQVTGAQVRRRNTGDYCPGDGNGTEDPNEECPYAEPAAYGLLVGAPPNAGPDGAAGAIREMLTSFNGISDIVNGNQISNLNWHSVVLDSETGIDGYGPALQDAVPYDVSRLDDAQENASHFEYESSEDVADNGGQDEATFFQGTLDVDGDNVTMTIPFYAPFWVYDPPSDPMPNEYFRLLSRSVSEVTGQNDTITHTGTLGDPLIQGDANRDGKVDGLDMNIVSLHWQKGVGAFAPDVHTANQRELHTVEHPKYSIWDEGDFDLDAATDETDLALLAANFGAGTGGGSGSGASQVPEPSSAVLAGLAGLVMLVAKRRHSGG